MTTKIQFGSTAPVTVSKKWKNKRSPKRGDVAHDGTESGGHQQYDHEVKFENIKAEVNVCRVKDDDADVTVGVAKGAILSGVPITVPSNTAAATVHAMKKRCDYTPHLSDISSFDIGHQNLMDRFEPFDEIKFDEDLFNKYLAKCGGAKADRLLAAIDSGELNYDGNHKHVFAKQEALLKEHRAQPRVVYQGTDMYNALTGAIVMELNDRMHKVFSLENPRNTGNRVIYACGLSGEELGDIMERSDGKPVESDMKNNDGSQSVEFRRREAMFYRKLGAPVWFVREFAKCTQVRVWTRYGITAHVKGQRWSGETTTTTGNSYVSMALLQAALMKAAVEESTSLHGGDDYLGFVKGDEEKVKAGIEAVTSVSGMKAEVVPQTSRHHATFYRKRYIRSAIGTRPVPQFGRVLAKLNLRANKNTQVNDRDYMAGKYLSAAYEHRFVPGIKDLLVATADRLSDTPHFDVTQTKLAEMGGAENVKRSIDSTPVHSVPEFSDFLSEVYSINYDDLFDVYSRVAQSCVDYCDGWTVQDKKTHKWVNKRNSIKYNAPKLCGNTVDVLVKLDV